MSTTADLVTALKQELKAARMTYADLALALGLAESSVKRMLARGDALPLSRVDAICRALKLDFADLARHVADAQPLLAELTQEQEQAVVADKKLLLVAICVLSQWTLEQITTAYRLSEAECVKYLAKTFRWRPHGPVMNYFREHALLDYFSGGFDGPGEGVLLVHGSVSRALAPSFLERMQKVAPTPTARATRCCWPCAAGSSRRSHGCGAETGSVRPHRVMPHRKKVFDKASCCPAQSRLHAGECWPWPATEGANSHTRSGSVLHVLKSRLESSFIRSSPKEQGRHGCSD
jgi:DNA-binding Xre family transcriptional regulator